MSLKQNANGRWAIRARLTYWTVMVALARELADWGVSAWRASSGASAYDPTFLRGAATAMIAFYFGKRLVDTLVSKGRPDNGNGSEGDGK